MNVNMNITFPDREETDLEQLNALLSSTCWSDVTLKDYDGYYAKTTTMDPDTGAVRSGKHWYGFDRIVLECRQEEDEPRFRYQVETEYLPQDQTLTHEQYNARWSKAHPNSVIRILSSVSFDDGGHAFVVFYHERVQENE